MKYRMRDGVEAWRITEENIVELADMVKGKARQNITIRSGRAGPLHSELSFHTESAGWVTLGIGDYVVLEQSGKYEAWDGVTFERLFEPVEDVVVLTDRRGHKIITTNPGEVIL